MLVAAGWLGAMGLAVVVGLAAISVIGSQLTSSDARPRTDAEVQRALDDLPPASATSSVPPSLSTPPRSAGSSGSTIDSPGGRFPAPPPRTSTRAPTTKPPRTSTTRPTTPATGGGNPAPVSRSFNTRAGTVVAGCSSAGATIESMSPKTGFAVHERDTGPAAEVEGEFRGTADNNNRIKFSVTCSGGRPVLTITDDRTD